MCKDCAMLCLSYFYFFRVEVHVDIKETTLFNGRLLTVMHNLSTV